jgi:glutamine amidotransferase
MKKVAIVDYGMGNIKSVQRGLDKAGAAVEFAHSAESILRADRLLLPGVGAFGHAMEELRKRNMIEALQEYSTLGKPLLGICLGMQILFARSFEHGLHEGLHLIPGSVVEIPQTKDGPELRKIPHIGWSALRPPQGRDNWSDSLLEKINIGEYFYFVHSFTAIPEDNSHLLAQCEYEGLMINAAVKRENVTGFQFHPEKSGPAGLQILEMLLRT